MMKIYSLFYQTSILYLVSLLFSCDARKSKDTPDMVTDPVQHVPVSFTAMGDVPYTPQDFIDLAGQIEKHDKNASSSFIIHLGDIKTSADSCNERRYQEVANILKQSDISLFIIPGDNEYNDCDDPITAFSFWKKYFLHFHKKWEFPFPIEYDNERAENFSWVQEDVLFIAINLVGGRVYDSLEWNNRLRQNADWVEQSVDRQESNVNAMVLFGHAFITGDTSGKFTLFTDRFREIAKNFGKPVLYLHGDGHVYIHDRPWPEANILRVQVDAGARLLEVTVDTKQEDPFIFRKDMFP
ncbi:MAG: hypothetical protein OEY51_10995 [Cyclobacteriaceae bacterium]|nr:hypothetical protein [Cyclobacteriaceae bacterium]